VSDVTRDPGTLAALVALGTLLGLDAVSVGQFMISRPLVGATLAGAMCSDMASGVLAGVLLEAVALETMPVGASRYPDWAPAGITAGTLAAVGGASAPALALALLLGIAVAWLSGRSMVVLRHANGRRVVAARPALDAGDPAMPAKLMGMGLAWDMVRSAVLATLAVGAVMVGTMIAARWRLDAFSTTSVTAIAALMVTASSTRQMFHGVAWARSLFAASLVGGVLLVAVWYV
jgi:PTS system mannose-specific IIC component